MSKCPQCSNKLESDSHFCFYCGFDIRTSAQLEDGESNTGLNKMLDLLQIGSVIGDRFKILRDIGRGNRGIVYEADDIVLEEKIALKVLYPHLTDDERMVRKLKREIKLARKIKHPNVCNIFDFGTVDDIFFISMEYIHGTVMSRQIVDRHIPDDQKTDILIGLARAMDAAHTERIVHRDLNPSNIMIDVNYRPIVMNFGIARYMGKSDIITTRHPTPSSQYACSPYYMAPEMFYSGKVDHRTDIYSFGIIAYELFTNSLPFTDSSPIAIAIMHMQNVSKLPRTLNPDIPEVVEEIILKCLQKKQVDRLSDAREILRILTGDLDSEPEDRPRVLVADDNENIRDLIGTILEDNGCQPVFAKDGEEAIARVMQTKPSLIFMDLMMPVLDGYQASEFLQSNSATSDIPIIMITSRIDEEYKAYSKSIGIKDHLTKPIYMELLVAKLDKYLNRDNAETSPKQ